MELTVLKRKLAWGSAAGLFRVGLAIPIYILLTPFILKKLGPELFGVWSLNTIIISFLNLTDFGFKNSLVYYVAKEHEKPAEINKHFNAVFWTYFVITLLAFTTVLILRTVIVRDLLRIPEHFHDEAVFVLLMTMGSFGVRFLAAPYQAVIEGHQEIYYSHLISLLWLLVYSIGSVLALLLSPDVYALGAVILAANVVVYIGFYGYVRRRYPFIKVSLKQIEREKLKSILKYGVGIQIATLVIALREPMYKILIARSYGLANVATFEIVYKLCTQLISVVVSPLLGVSATSAMLSDRKQDLEKVLRPFFGYALSILIPSALFFESFSRELINLWLGSNLLNAAEMLSIIFVAFAVYYVTETLYKAIEGSGLSSYSGAIQITTVIVHIGVFALLASYPFWSVPISILIGFLVFSLSNFFVFRWRFRDITLIRPTQILWVLIPGCLYILFQVIATKETWPFIFSAYLIAHLFCVRNAKIFDWIGMIKQFFSLKMRQRVPS
ncbi:MAG: oligosaccharide flippase family protein [Nitrospirae bacterium]|nr:oligosaccharide flippase family protein [Candidatus Manganitrophaceae bacterium]